MSVNTCMRCYNQGNTIILRRKMNSGERMPLYKLRKILLRSISSIQVLVTITTIYLAQGIVYAVQQVNNNRTGTLATGCVCVL